MDYFVRLMERLLLLSSYLGDEVINIASISRRHPDIAQEIVPVIESDVCSKILLNKCVFWQKTGPILLLLWGKGRSTEAARSAEVHRFFRSYAKSAVSYFLRTDFTSLCYNHIRLIVKG